MKKIISTMMTNLWGSLLPKPVRDEVRVKDAEDKNG